MPIIPVEVPIGERTYRIKALPPRKALEVSGVLFRNFGPSLAGLFEKDDIGLLDVSLPTVGAAIRELCQRDIVTELGYLWDTVLPQTEVLSPDRSTAVPLARVADAILPGAVHEMLALIWAHLDLNFRGFYAAARSSLGTHLAAVGKGAPSPT